MEKVKQRKVGAAEMEAKIANRPQRQELEAKNILSRAV